MSPYLFIICAEGLSTCINRAVQDGQITGGSTSYSGPCVSHLLFVDDSILFCVENVVETECILWILQKYEVASGQCVNLEKTGLFFSPHMPQHMKNYIKRRFGAGESTNMEKYLGLSAVVGRSRKQAFSYLLKKIEKTMLRWNYKLLSKGGKEVLLKAVAQAIPTYTMSVFMITPDLCAKI